MYIQVTTKCNMKCAHCLYACKPGVGSHMSFNTFKRAVNMAVDYDSSIAIGGGEPTLHPLLIEMLGYAALVTGAQDHNRPFMVTNGTCSREIWDILMRARKNNMLDVRVSMDPWHDTDLVHDWVSEDAEKLNLWWGQPQRVTTRNITLLGRAVKNKETLISDAENHGYERTMFDTYCTEPRVAPNGCVYVDTQEHFNQSLGELCNDTWGKAYDIISEYEESENT